MAVTDSALGHTNQQIDGHPQARRCSPVQMQPSRCFLITLWSRSGAQGSCMVSNTFQASIRFCLVLEAKLPPSAPDHEHNLMGMAVTDSAPGHPNHRIDVPTVACKYSPVQMQPSRCSSIYL